MSNPTLSVVVPTVGRKLLDKTLESIIAQEAPPDEIIVFDNSGSGSAKANSRYADDVRIHWEVSGFKRDIISSWNTAVPFASCDFVHICGDDDLLYPDFVREVKKALRQNCGCVYCPFDEFAEEPETPGKNSIPEAVFVPGTEFARRIMEFNTPYRLSSLVFSRDIFEKVGGFKDVIVNGLLMDQLFNVEAAFAAERVCFLPRPVWAYRTTAADWSGRLRSREQEAGFAGQINRYTRLLQDIFSANKTSLPEGALRACLRVCIRLFMGKSATFGHFLHGVQMFVVKERFFFLSRTDCFRDLFYVYRRG